MANVISTYGTADKFIKSALMGLGATQQDPNGRYYVDGSMVNVELSQAIVEAIYVDEIFREGQSITNKYTTDRKAGAVRVLVDTPFPPSSRTLSYGGRKGTKDNAGVFNAKPSIVATNDEVMIYLNQVNDQSMVFSDLQKEYIPLDILAAKIKSYAGSVAQDRSASTLAEVLAYSIFRYQNGGDNLITFTSGDGAYGNLVANVNSKMANGDPEMGAYTYGIEGRTIIGRPEFLYGMFAQNSGVILNGSDLAQTMLNNYDLDAKMGDREYVGANYMGKFGNIHFQIANASIWNRAEEYLNLEKGALDHIKAVAVYADGLAGAKVIDLGVKMVDLNGNKRGIEMQPLNIWGHECIRKQFIIGDNSVNAKFFTDLGFSGDVRTYPVAPSEAEYKKEDTIMLPVFDTQGNVIGYTPYAGAPTPNGGNIETGIRPVAAPVASVESGTYANAQSVTLTSATTGATIYYTTNGTEPTTASSAYSSTLTISATTTLKAFAYKAGMVSSDVVTYTYTIAGD